jgi:plastocyanin
MVLIEATRTAFVDLAVAASLATAPQAAMGAAVDMRYTSPAAATVVLTVIPVDPAAAITIQNFAFGGPLTVSPGETVTVTNSDSAPHNVTAMNGSFRTRTLSPGQSGAFVAPSAPGHYPFTCTLHPNMHGLLIVS